MGEFRIGRKFARHVYPDNSRAAALTLFARNSAVGPSGATDITTIGTPVPWDIIESGAPSGPDVPITPRVTGLVSISGVISVKSSSVSQESVQLEAFAGGILVPVPNQEQVSIDPDGFEAIPFLVLVPLTVGVPTNIRIGLIASTDNVLQIVFESSTILIQEMAPATG